MVLCQLVWLLLIIFTFQTDDALCLVTVAQIGKNFTGVAVNANLMGFSGLELSGKLPSYIQEKKIHTFFSPYVYICFGPFFKVCVGGSSLIYNLEVARG